jgi:flagellar hook assembly protein FlgD
VNRTITVSVGHLSTFVVLPSQASIIGTNTYTGQDIRIYNVPNPFNLRSKTVTLEKAEIADRIQTIEGTLVRYSLPSGKSGNVKIEIYDVAGDLVRVLTQSAPTDGTYYYLEWDGRTDGGDPVASGVYLARFTLNEGDEKMFRMAVIK